MKEKIDKGIELILLIDCSHRIISLLNFCTKNNVIVKMKKTF